MQLIKLNHGQLFKKANTCLTKCVIDLTVYPGLKIASMEIQRLLKAGKKHMYITSKYMIR